MHNIDPAPFNYSTAAAAGTNSSPRPGVYSPLRRSAPYALGINHGSRAEYYQQLISGYELPANHTSNWTLGDGAERTRLAVPVYQGNKPNATSNYFLGNCELCLTPSGGNGTRVTIVLAMDVSLQGLVTLQLSEWLGTKGRRKGNETRCECGSVGSVRR